MAKNQRGRNNNNPEGHNQYSNGWMDTAREKPFTTAAAAAAAVGAGVFLWSRRNQISDQINNLSGQLYDWADEMRSGNSGEMAFTEGGDSTGFSSSGATKQRGTPRTTRSTARSTRSQSPTAGQSINSGGAATEPFNS